MGTNFYWSNKYKEPGNWEDNSNIHVHIGKRSGAGNYCYDCGTTLCKYGTREIHFLGNDKWYDKCPSCGNQPEYCCSFNWTLMKHKKELEVLEINSPADKVVISEYGDLFTAGEFLAMLKQCPVQYQSPYEFS